MALTRGLRRRIFYALVALFCVVGIGVVFYAEGFRVNLATFQTETVGAIFVRSFPSDAKIFLDDKPIPNKTGFLSQGTFITNLTPGTYSLALTRDGFSDWHETAVVSSSLITEMKYAVLVPANATTALKNIAIKDFFESGGDVVAETNAGAIVAAGKVVGSGEIVDHAGVRSMITRAPNGIYRFYDLARNTSTNLSSIISAIGSNPSLIQSIVVDPSDPGTVFAETQARVLSISPALRDATILATTSPAAVLAPGLAISPSFIAWASAVQGSNTSSIGIYDRFLGTGSNAIVSVRGSVRSLKWIAPTALGILKDDGSLYRYDIAAQSLQKIASDVRSFSMTADGTALAALESSAVEVFSFADNAYYRFALPDTARIQDLAWYKDDNHIFVEYPDHVSFLDILDADLENFTTISAGTLPAYDPGTNALYLLNGTGQLIRFVFAE